MEVEVEVVPAEEMMSDATTPCTVSEVVVVVEVEVEVVCDDEAMGDTAPLCAMIEVVVMVEVEVEVEVVVSAEPALEATMTGEVTVDVIAVVVEVEVVDVGAAGAGTALEVIIIVEVSLEAGVVLFVAAPLPAKRSVCAPFMNPYAPLSSQSSARAPSDPRDEQELTERGVVIALEVVVPPAYLLATAPLCVGTTCTHSACNQ